MWSPEIPSFSSPGTLLWSPHGMVQNAAITQAEYHVPPTHQSELPDHIGWDLVSPPYTTLSSYGFKRLLLSSGPTKTQCLPILHQCPMSSLPGLAVKSIHSPKQLNQK